MDVAHAIVLGVDRGPCLRQERQARPAGHAANVLRRATLAGRAARDPASIGVVPVNETNLGFHWDPRSAAWGSHVASPPARLPNLVIPTADSQ